MTKPLQMLALVCLFALGSTILHTQDKPATPVKPPETIATKVTVVISRTQGEKRSAACLYVLSVTGSRGTLRLGTKIPVMMMTTGQLPKDSPMVGPIQYQDVGTNIDCDIRPLGDGRFLLNLTVDDWSVYADEQALPGGTKGNPSFRSFRASNAMVLKDGQSGQFTSATDKLTGETVKVDVTLTVVK